MAGRVVITGAGAVSALGWGVESLWEGLLAGRSGFAPVRLFDASRYQAKMAAEVDWAGAALRGFDRGHELALAAAEEAVRSSGAELSGERSAVAVGTTLGGNDRWLAWLADPAQPLERSSLDAGTRLLAGRYGARGPALTLSVACASGTAAIGAAAELIRRGEADRALAGGYDALSEFVFSGFDSLRALSTTAVRPFDRRRDGLGLGEGAAFVVLEREEEARRRGAGVLAAVTGYGSAGDAHHMTRPSRSGDGIHRAALAAMAQARVRPDDIAFVSAHGTATSFNDRMEAAAFERLFGGRRVPVNSIKSAVGHTLGAAGALEAILSALVLERSVIPPTVGYQEHDPECALDVVAGAPRELRAARTVLSTSSAFAGTNAALVLEAA